MGSTVARHGQCSLREGAKRGVKAVIKSQSGDLITFIDEGEYVFSE